jgi:hypothetical protein
MAYVVYHKETTRIQRRANGDEFFATEGAAKAHMTRKHLSDVVYGVAEYTYFQDNIEKQVERVNLMSRQKYMEPVNTPGFMSPSSEAYWSA